VNSLIARMLGPCERYDLSDRTLYHVTRVSAVTDQVRFATLGTCKARQGNVVVVFEKNVSSRSRGLCKTSNDRSNSAFLVSNVPLSLSLVEIGCE